MPTPTAFALGGFIAWALLLLIVMELLRTQLVVTRQVAANGFRPDNANLSPFMQRLARAHANCVESLPVFGGLMLLAIATNRSGVTDGLAYWFLVARIIQSCLHLWSVSEIAVSARFTAFVVQMAIGAWWAFRLVFP